MWSVRGWGVAQNQEGGGCVECEGVGGYTVSGGWGGVWSVRGWGVAQNQEGGGCVECEGVGGCTVSGGWGVCGV